MQTAILVDQEDWVNLTTRLDRLEREFNERNQDLANRDGGLDAVLTVREVAQRLNITEEAVRRARREGRLKGFKINEKVYGFHAYEVARYKNRYKRESV